MRRTFAIVGLLAGVTSTLSVSQAQSWRHEVGIQSGYTRVKPAGTGAADHFDLFGIPADLFGVFPTNASLFAILPWKNKLAVETSLSLMQGEAFVLLGNATFVTWGIRGNYAITPKFYAAAGGTLHGFESDGSGETQLGVQTAVGYRFPFVAGLHGRVEASALFLGNSEQLAPANAYAVTLGVSKQFGSRTRAAAARRTTNRAWEPVFGFQGGYARAHAVGQGYLTHLTLPGVGSAFTAFGSPAGQPTLFAIIPIGRKLAIEPGLDLHRLQSTGTTTFAGNLSARVNYAVTGGWYGALGGNLVHVKLTGIDAETLTGLNLGWGYRFPLTAGVGGRFEIDYSMMAKNDNLALPPINTVGLMFGATVPLR